MKALEKAAKDRADARVEPVAAEAAASAAAPKELSLEPLTTEPSAAARLETATRPIAGAAPTREQAQAQASTVMHAGAGRPAGRGVGAYLRAHPLPVLGLVTARPVGRISPLGGKVPLLLAASWGLAPGIDENVAASVAILDPSTNPL